MVELARDLSKVNHRSTLPIQTRKQSPTGCLGVDGSLSRNMIELFHVSSVFVATNLQRECGNSSCFLHSAAGCNVIYISTSFP